MSDSVQPQRWQPTRLPRPWDSPSKNTGVGCHFLLQCMKVRSESEVAQSFLTLVTPWSAAYQAPPSMGFSRQEYWSGLPLPSPLNILDLFILNQLSCFMNGSIFSDYAFTCKSRGINFLIYCICHLSIMTFSSVFICFLRGQHFAHSQGFGGFL